MDSEVRVPFEVHLGRLINHFEKRKELINSRLEEFSNVDKSDKLKLFEELAFCLLTPQSKAKACDAAIRTLKDKDLLMNGTSEQIAEHLKGVRFKYNKSRWIVEAREKFLDFDMDFSDVFQLREKIVKNFKGIGYKESSHFLRNIGFGADIAILDRHILKNIHKLGVIPELPKSISAKQYLVIENAMRSFCSNKIRMDQFDLLLWSEETGKVFK